MELDNKDVQLLEILEKNAKAPVQEISEKTGIPASTVHHRIKKLEANKIIKGYLRSVIITLLSLGLFGLIGMLIFLLISFLSKASLEAINYIEHYGLVRERGKPVRMRHSWNSNHFFSSIYLYNVTRHSDHHRNSNLKFWELQPVDKDTPILPYGYLTMLYLSVFIPYLYKKIMKKELDNWDLNFANEFERNLVKN